VRPLAALIRGWQDSGHPVGHAGIYFDQYHFYGRLRQPLERVASGQERRWLSEHPGGKVVTYQDRRDPVPPGAEYVQPYRDRTVLVVGERFLLGAAEIRAERSAEIARRDPGAGRERD
jgi:hypothetical protein